MHKHLARERLVAAAVAALVGVGPACALAQTDPSQGLYIGAGIGQSDVKDGCDVPGTVLTNCDTEDTAWKAYAGYQLNKWLAAELSYLQFADVDLAGAAGVVPFSATTETWGAGIHAVGMLPIPLDMLNRISVLGKVGSVYWDQERTSSLGVISADDNGWSLAWGVGLQLTISERLGVRAEWEQINDVGNESMGESDIDMWTVGVNFKF